MGCPSWTEIGDAVTLTFSICTHDPDTGILTDADDAPAYRIYEDETAAPIATGTMAKLDDDNTTGFYTERITISSANGYEHGKSYTIYVEATVDGNTGGIAYAFKALSPVALASVLAAVKLKTDTLGGAGAIAWDYTLTDSETGLPLAGADIWITTDSDGLNIVASGTTDQVGVASFMLDAGTIYVWRQKSGYNFTNPDIEEVSS